MKALSILQPWAWLIVNGHKDIENRRWRTGFRGEFVVHAGKRWGAEQGFDLLSIKQRFPSIALPSSFECGGIVGTACLVDCVDDHDSPWYAGEFGFVLRDARPLPFIPYKGALGFFTIPDSVMER